MILSSETTIPRKILNDNNIICKHDTIEFVIESFRCSVGVSNGTLPTWAACRSRLCVSDIPLIEVGFLPYISHPVTNYDTVYTARHNFVELLEQLNQKSLPVTCN